MSYILDALRKADADRERGHVPSIHAQTVLPGAAPTSAARATSAGWWVALGALVLISAVGLTWWIVGGSTQHTAPAVVAGAQPTPPAVAVAALPAPTAPPAPTPPAPVTTAGVEVPPAAAPATTAQAAAPKPKPKPNARPATPSVQATARPPNATNSPPMSTSDAPTTSPAAPTGAPMSPAVPQAADAAHAGKVYAIAELPDDIRRQLPSISVGGSMYSPVRANRILIVNGQVLHEGDRVTPEVVLEQVRVKAAVLTYKGYRYLVDF